MVEPQRSRPVIRMPGKAPIVAADAGSKPPAVKPAGAADELSQPTNPLACDFGHFPARLLAFARENKFEPLKWRIQKGEYILFSTALQKFHVPLG